MIPSVICLAILIVTLFLMRRRQRKRILQLKTQHWKSRMTERKLTYNRAWKDGYEFARAWQELGTSGLIRSHGDSQN